MLSNRELLLGLSGKDKRIEEALTNQPTDWQTFSNAMVRGATGLYQNIDNLTGNLADLVQGTDKPKILDRFNTIQSDPTKNEFEKAYESGKAYFGEPTTQGGVSALLNLMSPDINDNILNEREKSELEHQKYKEKQSIAGQYSEGGLGELSAEVMLATPIMKFGSMAKTRNALQSSENTINTAKAIGLDTAKNTALFGSTEFALGKAYGKSDEEATANAVSASTMALFGTPILGMGMKGLQKVGKAERQFQAEQAGGGEPTKAEQERMDKYSDIKYEEPPSPNKEEIKPTVEKLATKGGRTILSEDVKSGNKAISDIEYEAKEPREETPSVLAENEYVPEVNNPKKFKYGYDERGRVYTEESSLLSPQGGATQKATLQQRTKPKIDNPIEEVNRRLEFYDNDSKLRKRYGQTQASYKKDKDITKAQEDANRLEFEKEQYKDIIKSESGEVQREARSKLDELNKIKIKDYIASPKQIAKAQKIFDEQTKVVDSKLSKRDDELRKEFKEYIKSKTATSKKGYEFDKPTKTTNETVEQVIKNAKLNIPKAKEAIRTVAKKERLAGRKFDPSKITESQRNKYREDISIIENVQGARQDLNLFKEGKIPIEEFRYREKRRLDDKLETSGRTEFKTKSELEQYRDNVIKQYDDIGVFVDKKDVNIEQIKSKSKFEESPEKKLERETSELEDAKTKNTSTKNSLYEYKNTGKVPRYKTGSKAGQYKLSKSQIKDIDEGILTVEEIANKTSPISTKSELKEKIAEARELANRKSNLSKRESLGIKDNFAQKAIKFKETLMDASNSVAQITTVLLSDKKLAKLSKLYGGKTDIREIIAEEMKKLLPEDFPVTPSKDVVKPMFMTENYGQGSKGLIRNIMKKENLSKEDATTLFNAYEKAFDNISPEMLNLRNTIYSMMEKNPNGEFSWTLPDGFEVSFKLQKKQDGTYSIKGKNVPIKIETETLDEFSRALMPNVIHSVDAYVAREMNKRGIGTVHDAFQTPVGKSDDYVRKAYGEIMSSINDSNLLDSIMKDIGYDGKSLKTGDLESSKIKESASKDALAPEEVKGETELAKARELDVSKSNTTDEVMKEYIASGNVREGGFNTIVEQMTNEAGYRTMSKAMNDDDVFTRQVALAHQSPKYNTELSIKAPDGVNEKVWNKVQEDIFNEARARLEYNPLLKDTIRGERKFFTRDGKFVGEQKKTFNEILREVQKSDRVRYNKIEESFKDSKTPEEVKTIKEDTSKINEELGISKPFKETIENWKAGYKTGGVYSQIKKLHSLTRSSLNKSAKVGQVTKNTIEKIYSENNIKNGDSFDVGFQRSVIDTDFNSIKMSEKEAMDFLQENKSLYNSISKYIDQSAKGMRDKGEMNHPDYFSNPMLIIRHTGLPFDVVDKVDKLISIKSMKKEDWKFIEENKNSTAFKEISKIVDSSREQTKSLFAEDPTKMMKGYRLEAYESLYRMEAGNKVLDVGGGAEQGALPINLLSKKVGDRDIASMKDISDEAYYNVALEEGLGIVFDRSANPMALRKVATEVERNDLGRKVSAMDTLSLTIESNTRKLAQADGVIKEAVRMLEEGNDLFSKHEVNGFVRLSDDEIKSFPKELRDIKYVNKDFKNMLLGNKEIQIFKEGSKSVIEQIYKDGFIHFKQNVVLKNPASWVNNYMFGIFMNTNAGLNPKQAFTYSKKAPAIYSEMQKLTEQLIELEIKGITKGARYESVKSKLESNEIYQMVENGMAVSVMADLIKTSGKAHLFTDRAVSKGLRKILGDKATELLSNLYLHQASDAGKIANGMFTRIDIMHRYALTKWSLEQGMTIEEAVAKSNGVYGDLDLIAPVWSQAIQHYGFVPFSNWFFRVSGGISDTARKNIMKTIALSGLLYGASELTDRRTESWNPLLSLVNTPIDFLEMSPYSQPINTIKNIAMPKVYQKAHNSLTNEDPLSIALTQNF